MTALPPTLEERGYEATRTAMAILERSLMKLTRKRAESGPNFHFDAVQLVEEILKLRGQIDDLIGLTAFLTEFGPPPPVEDDAPPPVNGRANGTAARPSVPAPAAP